MCRKVNLQSLGDNSVVPKSSQEGQIVPAACQTLMTVLQPVDWPCDLAIVLNLQSLHIFYMAHSHVLLSTGRIVNILLKLFFC